MEQERKMTRGPIEAAVVGVFFSVLGTGTPVSPWSTLVLYFDPGS